jgi:hypothetical protein
MDLTAIGGGLEPLPPQCYIRHWPQEIFFLHTEQII